MQTIEIKSQEIEDILTAQTLWSTIPANLRNLWKQVYPTKTQIAFIGSIIAIKQGTGVWPVTNSFSPDMCKKICADRNIEFYFSA